MKALTSFLENCIISLPIAFCLATVAYGLLIWMAIRKKDFVKATIWHRTSGFSIEARSHRAKRTKD